MGQEPKLVKAPEPDLISFYKVYVRNLIVMCAICPAKWW